MPSDVASWHEADNIGCPLTRPLSASKPTTSAQASFSAYDPREKFRSNVVTCCQTQECDPGKLNDGERKLTSRSRIWSLSL